MKKPAAESKVEVISDILKVSTGTFECCILGTSPLVINRMSEKAKQQLLLPSGRKSASEKILTLKHNPEDEFRSSVHSFKSDSAPTFLAMPTTAFKGSIRSAALDMPGMKKAQIGRLTYIAGDYIGIYGIPKLLMRMVRMSDIAKTPDVRSRAIVPAWACRVNVTFVQPLIRAQAVANLLAAAGITIGVGDGRPEKGALSNGQFKIVDDDDPEFLDVINSGARPAQVAAMADPEPYDDETAELLAWYHDEVKRRSLRGVA